MVKCGICGGEAPKQPCITEDGKCDLCGKKVILAEEQEEGSEQPLLENICKGNRDSFLEYLQTQRKEHRDAQELVILQWDLGLEESYSKATSSWRPSG